MVTEAGVVLAARPALARASARLPRTVETGRAMKSHSGELANSMAAWFSVRTSPDWSLKVTGRRPSSLTISTSTVTACRRSPSAFQQHSLAEAMISSSVVQQVKAVVQSMTRLPLSDTEKGRNVIGALLMVKLPLPSLRALVMVCIGPTLWIIACSCVMGHSPLFELRCMEAVHTRLWSNKPPIFPK